MQKKIKNKKAFTLIEILLGILIVSVVMLFGFQAFSSILYGKTNLFVQTELQKDSFYFNEKLFDMIKKGGVIDYEEYFNRKLIGDTSYSSGHFAIASGYGNFGRNGSLGTSSYGEQYYKCRSGIGNSNKLGKNGCYSNLLNNLGINHMGSHQRYGQYSFQFIDYNSDYDNDLGDENADGNIVGDDDDDDIGYGPEVFSLGTPLRELYLMSGDKKKRTFFRWNVEKDPLSGTKTCSIDNSNTISGEGCLGTIQFLELEGRDWGFDHVNGTSDAGEYDGVIDTWVIAPHISGQSDVVAGGSNDNGEYWVDLFSPAVNVVDFKLELYPHKSPEHAWKEVINVAPYVKLSYVIEPSWESKSKIRSKKQSLFFSTTIALNDMFSK